MSLVSWLIPVGLIVPGCSGETATTETTATTTEAPKSWDGTPRDTLVMSELADANNLVYIVAETVTDSNITTLIQTGGFDSEFDCEIEFKPWRYKTWSFSEDGKVLQIELDPSVKWADGKPVTAEDIQFTYDLIRDPVVASPRLAYTERMVEGKDPLIVDPTHIEFHYTNAYDKPSMMAHADMPVVPKHLLENADRATLRGHDVNAKDPMENGPFKLAKWERGQSLMLEANENYSGPESFKPRIKRLLIRIIPEYATRLVELETGGLDMMEGIQIADADRLRKEHPELNFYRRGWRTMDYVAWNILDPADYKRVANATPAGKPIDLKKVKPHPLFGDVKVRQALAHAVDIDKIIKDLLTSETGEAYARPATGTVTPALCATYNDEIKPFPHDATKAKAMLAEAGWADTNGDGVLDKDGKKFSFTLTTNSGNARRNKATIILQAQLKEVGIDVALEQVEGNLFFERLRKKDFEASLGGWSAALFVDPTDQWHSGSQYQFNFTSYDNPHADELIEKGMMEPDPAKSNVMWKDLQATIYDDQPYLFLWWLDDTVAVHERFRDATPDVLSSISNVWHWWVAPDEVKYPN